MTATGTGMSHRGGSAWRSTRAAVLMVLALALWLPAPARASVPSGVRFTTSTTAAGATGVTWGFRVQTTTALGPGNALTITAPNADAFAGVNQATMIDLTTGVDELAGTQAAGSTVAVSPRNAIAPGDIVAVDVFGVTNPAGGTAFSSLTVSPSGGISEPGTFASGSPSVTGVTFTPSTTGAGATGVT
jgi:hypothetical protein